MHSRCTIGAAVSVRACCRLLSSDLGLFVSPHLESECTSDPIGHVFPIRCSMPSLAMNALFSTVMSATPGGRAVLNLSRGSGSTLHLFGIVLSLSALHHLYTDGIPAAAFSIGWHGPFIVYGWTHRNGAVLLLRPCFQRCSASRALSIAAGRRPDSSCFNCSQAPQHARAF